MGFRPRIYQTRADAAIAAAWDDPGVRAVLAVLATGLGKTWLAAMIAERRRSAGKTLFLAHREELIWQAEPAFEEIFGVKPGIEMGQDYRVNSDMFAARSPIVLGTVQTQFSGARGKGRMTHFDPREFSTLIVDEAHHYVSPSYQRVVRYYLNGNPDLKLLGLTATPKRADKLAMGRIFERSVFNYGIVEGIADGWLVPVDQWAGTVSGIDLSEVPEEAGDLDPEKLAKVMERSANVFGVIDHALERVGEMKTLHFASSKEHAELMASIINKRVPEAGARVVHYKTPTAERRQMFRDFYERKFQHLCNFGICTEGFNDPRIEAVSIARPTTSTALYTQMIGRGTRPLDSAIVDPYEDPDDRKVSIAESAKPSVLVLDFVGNSGQHKLISAADVLGGNYDREVRDRAKRITLDAPKPKSVQAALSEAAVQIMAERRRREEEERGKLAGLRFDSSARFEQVDPFSHEVGDGPRKASNAPEDRGRPLSEGMIAFLDRYAPKGTDLASISFPEAGRMIKEIKRRWDAGLCSIDQSRVLAEKQLPAEVPKETAKDWMNRLALNRWQVPADLRREAREFERMRRKQDRGDAA